MLIEERRKKTESGNEEKESKRNESEGGKGVKTGKTGD